MSRDLDTLLRLARAAEPSTEEWTNTRAQLAQALAHVDPAGTTPAASDQPGNSSTNDTPNRESGLDGTIGQVQGPKWALALSGAGAIGVLVAAAVIWFSPPPNPTYGGAESRDGMGVTSNDIALTAMQRDLSWDMGSPSSDTLSRLNEHHLDVAPTAPNTQNGAIPTSTEQTSKVTSSAIESDYDYDRRHLEPINRALLEAQPQTALDLLNAFQPRYLTQYTSALRAIALCQTGRRVDGQRLARRLLKNLADGPLRPRVERACNATSSKTQPRREHTYDAFSKDH